MIVLDTNVVSELMRPNPHIQVLRWIDGQPPTSLYITSVTSAELLLGITRLPDGHRKNGLSSALADLLDEDFDGRILPFDAEASVDYAQIVAERSRSGRPIGIADAMIAATALSRGATLVATRNTKDFTGT